ncbi:CRISPR-associated endonuclease Cas1 [Koleobacter methoxysyntrophicus]|uniref:CRISPR-associated endonuclease Cas1 n=1 Tax=Koleobacter methoxysyntrophicus TaxID=2751313 RepID=A0A8A0RM40_9FIRM|nr:CRISPR-associated endonuclease Cas1 [Koleobacter methoxysyntrophicus]QSQ08589.1 CRISPR-associated endonuclease Cas1 [Koleobacter methoxysyntrophicus]
MSYLYVTEPGTRIQIKDRQIIAEKKDGLKIMLPIEKLEGLIIVGNSWMNAGCAVELLERGIPVTYLSSRGRFFGRLESTRHINIERQREQFRCGDDAKFCLSMAIKFISGKIHNQIVVLRRFSRNRDRQKTEEIVEFIKKIKEKTETASSIEQIMGYEGTASKKYFEGLSLLIDREFRFNGRTRMPPRDPFNSLLSFGYTLLLYEAYTAVVNKGLHPYAGIMHKDRQGHPALASDLIEEWRPIIVDSLSFSLLEKGTFKKEDFIKNEKNGGVYLDKNQTKKFIKEFEKKLRTEAGYLENIKGRMSFRRALQHQTGMLAKAIENRETSFYNPVKIR